MKHLSYFSCGHGDSDRSLESTESDSSHENFHKLHHSSFVHTATPDTVPEETYPPTDSGMLTPGKTYLMTIVQPYFQYTLSPTAPHFCI